MKQTSAYVGSFLRPQELRQARQQYKEGQISQEELTKVENKAIDHLIDQLSQQGWSVLTDGEFRRETWYLDFMWAFDGVDHQPTEFGIPFHDEVAKVDDTYLVGPLSVGHHPFVDHFTYLQERCQPGQIVKQTIPAPAQFLQQFIFPFNLAKTKAVYPNLDDLIKDIVSGYRKVIQELYDAGCRFLQLDDCSWGILVDESGPTIFQCDQAQIDAYKEQFLSINNAVLENWPSDLVLATHVCRGNYHSSWACQGGYDAVAQTLLAKEKVDIFFLEYDDERSGSFEPLQYVPKDKLVVLGLVTTKKGQLEKAEDIKQRIKQASQYHPLEKLALSPQCGFASCECGNQLTEEEQFAKLAFVLDVAQEVWNHD